MRKITTILFAVFFSTAAIAAHVPGHTVAAPTKKTAPSVDTKKWMPPLEIQNKTKK